MRTGTAVFLTVDEIVLIFWFENIPILVGSTFVKVFDVITYVIASLCARLGIKAKSLECGSCV
jgi:hypothetical protein